MSETSKESGRCRQELDALSSFNDDHQVLADAIDRLAADVAEIKEAVCDGDEAIRERDKYKRERDAANAEVRRLISELAAAIRTIRELQADRVERQQPPAAPHPAAPPVVEVPVMRSRGDTAHEDGRDAEIARLTAQVEWHRMPTEVRRGVEWAVKESKYWADEDEHDQTHGQRASALAAYLERTKPKEESDA